jgi:hypothetical protein
MPYLGSQLARGFATTTKQSFSGDASTVAFTLTRNAGQATDLEVFVDNVQQEPTTAYGVSGTTLTFTAAPSTGTNNIYVIHRGGGSTGNLPPQDLGATDYIFRDDISFKSDSAKINFGADSDITLTHVADTGLILKNTHTSGNSGIGAILTLQTGDTDVAANNVLGQIDFQAPDEGTGTDAILKAASIQAVSEGDFSSSSNATSIVLNTASTLAVGSAADGGKLTLNSTGDLTLKDVRTADGSSPTITLQSGDTDIAADDVLGTINFQAPDEGTGTDAILVAAGISAVSEGDFSSSSNATSLKFVTGNSAAAGSDGGSMILSSTGNLTLKDLRTADGSSPTITLQSGDTNMEADDVLGTINFQAPDEGTGTDAILVAAGIAAVSEGDFSSSANATSLVFKTGASEAAAEKMRIDSAGNVGIGATTIDVSTQAGGSGYKVLQIESDEGGQLNFDHNDAGTGSTLGQINFQRAGEVVAEIEGVTDGATDNGRLAFRVQPDGGALTEAMRITHEGNVQIGTTTDRPDNYNGSGSGTEFSGLGLLRIARNGDMLILNRISTDGDIINFNTDGSGFGQIGLSGGNNLYISGTASVHGGLTFATRSVLPALEAAVNDDGTDLGQNGNVFRDIYAGNTSIQTSDEREKQQIASLTDKEIIAAKSLSKLFKTFKWNNAVETKGDNARTHTGHIAQQVETAMSDAGLDVGNYAFFVSGTWWETQTEVPAVEADEENGIKAKDAYTRTDTYQTKEEAPEGATERNRKSLRYAELLAFIGAATEQRLTSIESRLTALEAE